MGKIIYDFIYNILVGSSFEQAQEISTILTAISISLIYFVLIKLVLWLFGVVSYGSKTRRF